MNTSLEGVGAAGGLCFSRCCLVVALVAGAGCGTQARSVDGGALGGASDSEPPATDTAGESDASFDLEASGGDGGLDGESPDRADTGGVDATIDSSSMDSTAPPDTGNVMDSGQPMEGGTACGQSPCVCAPRSTQACQSGNLVGTQSCLAPGLGWDTCGSFTSCTPGYSFYCASCYSNQPGWSSAVGFDELFTTSLVVNQASATLGTYFGPSGLTGNYPGLLTPSTPNLDYGTINYWVSTLAGSKGGPSGTPSLVRDIVDLNLLAPDVPGCSYPSTTDPSCYPFDSAIVGVLTIYKTNKVNLLLAFGMNGAPAFQEPQW